MNLKETRPILYITIIITSIVLYPGWSCANDSATEVTPTGLHFKREDHVSIEREELCISLEKVEVSYEFKNGSNKDIVTEMAFPIPDYEYSFSELTPSFDDFAVEVNGKAIPYNTEARALLKEKNYTKTLEKMNISISDFGQFDPTEENSFFAQLTEKNQRELVSLGLVREDGWPLWTVSKKFYWSQTFPANSSVIIKHHYTPYIGFRPFGLKSLKSDNDMQLQAVEKDRHFLERDACVDKDTMTTLEKYDRPREEGLVWGAWVSYILTTANNWKQPIKSFHLIIEKNEHDLMSLCFAHTLAKTGPNRYEVEVKNFVPTSNLKVYFFKDSKSS